MNIENFMGIYKVSLDFNPDKNLIIGNNGVGKTVIFSSYMFLLFGTDSFHAAKFNILPNIEHGKIKSASVEGVFNITENKEQRVVSLKRVYKSKNNTDKNLQAASATTLFYINDKKVSKKKYLTEIESFAPAETLKILSSPAYFFNKLTKKEQRNIIIDLIGDISNSEIISKNEDLERIHEICKKNDAVTQRSILVTKNNDIDKNNEEKAAKITELLGTINEYSDVEDLDLKELETELKLIEKKIEKTNLEIADSSVDTARSQELLKKNQALNREQIKLEKEKSKKRKIETKFEQEKRDRIEKLEDRIRKEKREAEQEKRAQDGLRFEKIEKIEKINEKIESKVKDLDEMRAEYQRIKKNKESAPDVCFHCKQKLPDNMLVDQEEKFNKELKSMNKIGSKKNNEIEALKDSLTKAKKEQDTPQNTEEYTKKIEAIKSKVAGYRQEIEIESQKKAIGIKSVIQKCESILYNINVIKKEIDKIEESPISHSQAVKNLRNSLTELRERAEEISDKISSIKHVEKLKKRVEKRNEEKIELIDEQQQNLADIAIIDKLHNIKAKTLEDRINNKNQLGIGEIKLFEPLVQGGLQPTCILTHDGTDYTSLNNATKKNAELSFGNAISKAAGVRAPVWLDAAESVQEIIEVESQFMQLDAIIERHRKLPKFSGKELRVNAEKYGVVTWSTPKQS